MKHHLLSPVKGNKLEHIVSVEQEIFPDEESWRVKKDCRKIASDSQVFIDVVGIKPVRCDTVHLTLCFIFDK